MPHVAIVADHIFTGRMKRLFVEPAQHQVKILTYLRHIQRPDDQITPAYIQLVLKSYVTNSPADASGRALLKYIDAFYS